MGETGEMSEVTKRMEELRKEMDTLVSMQERLQKQMTPESDARSVFVGNLHYACTPQQVKQHFAQFGDVKRVTIPVDEYGHPKAYAYVEFEKEDEAKAALALDGTELLKRKVKVVPKRTNVPGKSRTQTRYSPYMRPYMHRGRPGARPRSRPVN